MIQTRFFRPDFVVHDSSWQTPAITEANAFRTALGSLPNVPGFIYFAFPWATLIDQIVHRQDFSVLRHALAELGRKAAGFNRVVTVCQHIFLGEHRELFAEAGVTDIFWPHLRKSGPPPEFAGVSLRAFPLYPANSPGAAARGGDRTHLFCFVGAKPNALYLDDARALIVEILGGVAGGWVRERPDWHFYRDVYERQIYRLPVEVEDPLGNPEAVEYRAAMADSVFVLCPSGTGPSSLRLWEAVDCGAIPVLMAPQLTLPGAPSLWADASVACEPSRAAIAALPDRLRALAADPVRIAAMRRALGTIRSRYGRDVFVRDIIDLYRANQPG